MSEEKEFGPIRHFTSKVLMGTIVSFSRLFLRAFNSLEIIGEEEFHEISTYNRKRGLLTISNHQSTIDEPVLMSNMLHPSTIFTPSKIRYAICARDICFKNSFSSEVFKLVQALPIERGSGIHQNDMKNISSKLQSGHWVHIFPEGRISQTGTMNPIKLGTAKLILDTDPVVIPFYHEGMSSVLPAKTYFPQIGKKIGVIVGGQIKFDDIIERYHRGVLAEYICLSNSCREEAHDEITSRITRKFEFLSGKMNEFQRSK
jgi:monolysocardiolipin acyltransferase